MAVAFDARITAGNSADGFSQQANNVTSISSTGLTIGGSATGLLVGLGMGDSSHSGITSSAWAITWNGVTVPIGPTKTFTDTGPNILTVVLAALGNPATGNHTLAASWTGANDCYMGAASFTGTDTATVIATADNITGSGGSDPYSITVTSTTDGATVALASYGGGNSTSNQTLIFTNSPFSPGAAMDYALGGTSVTHTFSGGGGFGCASAGVHILAPVAFYSAVIPLRIANRNVGPRVKRRLYRQPQIRQASSGASVFQQALTATAVAVTAVFTLTINKIMASTAVSATASIIKSLLKNLTATVVNTTATLVKSVGKSMIATAVAVTAVMSAIKVILVTMTATAVSVTATMVKSVGKNMTSTAVSATASMSRVVGKILAAASNVSAAMTRLIGKFLVSLAVAVTATMTAIRAFLVTMTTTVSVTASLVATFIAGVCGIIADYIPIFRPRRR